ncbi:hypothetical protein AJ79_09388 [Helicocarpus griseus UAMH5409]|uniref:Uncharacterized protein n=1 Tax=Helicocarpus griseus UAMH5409 TaxID=1447875 RepID=A0A2B7WK18_9EURO|nr:hypothetical protein AJ79_09388 [Helicocarpus griseus UAMH5409]
MDEPPDPSDLNLPPATRQLIVDATDRVNIARSRLLVATNAQQRAQAQSQLALAQTRLRDMWTMLGYGGVGVEGDMDGDDEGDADGEWNEDEEEAEQMEVEEGVRTVPAVTPQTQPQPLFGSVTDIPIHPPLSNHSRFKSYLRERRHASVSILMDQELLMTHAMANYETIPEARRRFQHHYVGLGASDNYKHAFALQESFMGPKNCPVITAISTTDPPTTSHLGTGISVSPNRKGKGKAKAISSSRPGPATRTRSVGATSLHPTASSTSTSTSTFAAPPPASTNSSDTNTPPHRLPVIDILEVNGGWLNRPLGEERDRDRGTRPGLRGVPVLADAAASAAAAGLGGVGRFGGGGLGSGNGMESALVTMDTARERGPPTGRSGRRGSGRRSGAGGGGGSGARAG